MTPEEYAAKRAPIVAAFEKLKGTARGRTCFPGLHSLLRTACYFDKDNRAALVTLLESAINDGYIGTVTDLLEPELPKA